MKHRNKILGGLLAITLLGLCLILLSDRFQVFYCARSYRTLRASNLEFPPPGTEEDLRSIILSGGVKKGARISEITALLGAPNVRSQRDDGWELVWVGTDLSQEQEYYVFRFDKDEFATFVPFVEKEYYERGYRVADIRKKP